MCSWGMELGKVLLEAEKEATKSLWAPLVLLFHTVLFLTVLFHTVLWRTTVTLELPTSAPLFGQILAALSFHQKWSGDNMKRWKEFFCGFSMTLGIHH